MIFTGSSPDDRRLVAPARGRRPRRGRPDSGDLPGGPPRVTVVQSRWEEEHDRHLLRCLLGVMEIEFEPATMQAFRRVLEGASGVEAAGELGLSVAAVYTVRLCRAGPREVAAGLIDELG